MPDEARSMATQHGAGIRAAAHQAHLLTDRDLDGVDLAIALAREHRRHIVEMNPALLRKTFTLRELERLMSGLSDVDLQAAASKTGMATNPRARLGAMLALVGSLRGVASAPVLPEDDDVTDPFGRSLAVYEHSTSQLANALPAVERLIRLSGA